MLAARILRSGETTILLLEREAQVAALQALVDAAPNGEGRFVVIEGSAGIGKTLLLAEARAIAGTAGMRVLAARGRELEGPSIT
jgi:predicted ATPase